MCTFTGEKKGREKVLIFRIAKRERERRPEEERDDLRGSLAERAGDSARQLASAIWEAV